jgi:hypothetical protein
MTRRRRQDGGGAQDGAAAVGDEALARRHLAVGWTTVFVFLLLGLGLEVLHAAKLDLYLNVANETRRLMWTLAHAHGTLLGLLHMGFAVTVRSLPTWFEASRRRASRCLDGATLLLPGGFLLGGAFIHSGDPGLGILLVPVGAVLLAIGAFVASRAAFR